MNIRSHLAKQDSKYWFRMAKKMGYLNSLRIVSLNSRLILLKFEAERYARKRRLLRLSDLLAFYRNLPVTPHLFESFLSCIICDYQPLCPVHVFSVTRSEFLQNVAISHVRQGENVALEITADSSKWCSSRRFRTNVNGWNFW